MTVSSTFPSTINAASATSSAAAAASTSTAASASTTAALSQLAGNFSDFLSLLTTQLQNQDPTSPMDTNQFTSELVEFTSVSEQINTNSTLGQLLNASLGQQLTQASSLVGSQVTFSGGTLPLQNGSAQVDFQTTAAEPVQITVSNSSGNTVASQQVQATSGSNTWTWNGTSNGKQLADGAYTLTVTGNGQTVPFQALGTVTGAQQSNQTVQLMFGTAAVPFSDIVTLDGAPAAAGTTAAATTGSTATGSSS